MVDFDVHQQLTDHRFEVIPARDCRHDALNGHVVPGCLALNVKFFSKISGARGYADDVGRSLVGHLVDGIKPFIRQILAQPADRDSQLRAAGRQLNAAVGIIDRQRELISFKAAIVRKRQRDQPLAQLRQILAASLDCEIRNFHRVAQRILIAVYRDVNRARQCACHVALTFFGMVSRAGARGLSVFVVSVLPDPALRAAGRRARDDCRELKKCNGGYMAEERFHGARVRENTDLVTAIDDIDSSVIGIIAVADDADEETFPLNTPVLLRRVSSVLSKAGKTGTLYKSLKAISDQCSPRTIVVRVGAAEPDADGKTSPTQSQLVTGGTAEDGSFIGAYALLAAKQKTGYQPRILAAPDLDTKEVLATLTIIAEKLRAFVYAGCNGCSTVEEAERFRMSFNSRELMVIWPDFIAYNPLTGQDETFPASAYACGLRALIDHNQGWHKFLSNVAVKNVLGVSRDVYWSLQSEDSDANYLNNCEVTTLITRDGFRFWGNRTTNTETYTFEVFTRTAQILADSIAEAQFTTVDSPLTPANVKDVISGIRRKLDGLVTSGRLIGASCWYDTEDNTTTTLRAGQLRIRYSYSPVPPLEDLTLFQTFTDEYYESAFSSLGGV